MTNLPSKQKIAAAYAGGTLTQQIATHFGGLDSGSMTTTVAAEVASLHNSGEIDLFRLVEDGSILALDGPSFFVATHFLDSVLPELVGPVDRVMSYVDKLVERGGSDFAANAPNVAFREWCARDPSRSAAVAEAAIAGDPLANKFLVFALEASMDVELAKRIALMESGEGRFAGIAALGRIPATDDAARADRIATLAELLTPDSDDQVRAAVLHASTNLLTQRKQKGEGALLQVVALAADGGDVLTVHHAAQMLWSASDRLDHASVAQLLATLMRLKPENKGTIEVLDYGLSGLVKNGHSEQAIAFVTELLLAKVELRIEHFDDFLRTVSANEELLGATTIRWLNTGSAALCDGLAQALQHDDLRGRALSIPAAAIPVDPYTQAFVCRKAIGFFFLLPTTTASVMAAVLREAVGDAIVEVQELMFDPLLVNYAGAADYLESIPKKDPVRVRVQVCLDRYKHYLEGLRTVEKIPELEPSEHRQQIYQRRIGEEMSASFKRARKESPLFGMFRHSTLLYGRGAVSFVRDADESLRPVEMDLHSHGVSMESPRTMSIDPIGLDHMLNKFRAEKLKK